MSRRLVDQDWETNASPFTFLNTMARSTTNAIAGTDLRGGDGTAKDGEAAYTIASSRPSSGSRRGLRIQGSFDFKLVTPPAGGFIKVLSLDGSTRTWRIRINDGTQVLRWSDGTTTVAGTTALGSTAHTITVEYREELLGGFWVRIWLDGALEIEHRSSSGLRIATLTGLSLGVAAAGKCTWEAVWGRMRIWHASDPQ